MNSKIPEIIAIAMLICILVFPPWQQFIDVGVYSTRWAFVTSEFEDREYSKIDIALLAIELVAVGGFYFLIKKLFERNDQR
jgi:hypothetical protein